MPPVFASETAHARVLRGWRRAQNEAGTTGPVFWSAASVYDGPVSTSVYMTAAILNLAAARALSDAAACHDRPSLWLAQPKQDKCATKWDEMTRMFLAVSARRYVTARHCGVAVQFRSVAVRLRGYR